MGGDSAAASRGPGRWEGADAGTIGTMAAASRGGVVGGAREPSVVVVRAAAPITVVEAGAADGGGEGGCTGVDGELGETEGGLGACGAPSAEAEGGRACSAAVGSRPSTLGEGAEGAGAAGGEGDVKAWKAGIGMAEEARGGGAATIGAEAAGSLGREVVGTGAGGGGGCTEESAGSTPSEVDVRGVAWAESVAGPASDGALSGDGWGGRWAQLPEMAFGTSPAAASAAFVTLLLRAWAAMPLPVPERAVRVVEEAEEAGAPRRKPRAGVEGGPREAWRASAISWSAMDFGSRGWASRVRALCAGKAG